MRCKALETIRQNGMLQSGHVLLGVSGGADSMSLLHLLCALRSEMHFALECAHVHHGIRGAEADRDEQFVRQMCEQWHVPLHVLHADIPAECARTGESTEACGRRVRYDFFQSLAKGEIATAHTADDNAETVLLHLIRGSGIEGLRGMKAVRGNIIRPLLSCTRADIERYCLENGVPYVTDSTNLSDDYARNRVRHHVLPEMRKLNPRVNDALLRLSAFAAKDDDCLRVQTRSLLKDAERPFGFDTETLLSAHPALRERAIRLILSQALGASPEAHHVAVCAALLQKSGAVQVSDGVTVCVFGGLFYLRVPQRESWTARICGNTADLPFGRAKIQTLSAEKIQKIHKQDLAKCLCCDTIQSDIFFRSRLPGDRMTRVGGAGEKTMKKLFEELGVPACRRNDIPILTDGQQILWAQGVGCNAPFAVTPQSRNVWMIEIIREEKE